MAVCPTCHGEGGFDQRELNAMLEEHLTPAELALARATSDWSDWIACDTCGETGEVTEDVRLDALAAARARVDQLVAGYDRGDFDAKLARMGIPRR